MVVAVGEIRGPEITNSETRVDRMGGIGYGATVTTSPTTIPRVSVGEAEEQQQPSLDVGGGTAGNR